MIQNRYRRIVLFFARILLSLAFWDLLLPRLGLGARSRLTRTERYRRSAAAFRILAIQMGGVLIKVGQFLSTRVDVLPPEIISELSNLQDEVPPASFADIRRAAEADLGTPLSEKFDQFEETPLAAASLGQAHRARLKSGEFQDVVVKVQRPNIEAIIATDLAALRTVGNWLRRYPPIRRRADVPALLDEFIRILYQEIDYLNEGHNAETFAANFKDQVGVRVPHIIWTHTTRHVLTLENVWAIKITDYQAITAAGISLADVASRLLDTYLKQIFEDSFFHADPHPGNLFIRPLTREPGEENVSWQLTFVDFGMVGHVPANLRDGLRELLIGVGTQDASRVVKSYQTLGVLLPTADLLLLEKAEAKLFEQFWGKNMTELSHIDPGEVREFLGEFRELLYALPFQVPHDIIYLGRAVAILSGMCTGLDPSFNVWDHLAPYAKKLVLEETRFSAEGLLDSAASLARALVSVPKKMDTILGRMERGEIAVRAPEVTRQVTHMEGAIRQVTGGLVFAALLLSGVQLYLANHQSFGEVLLVGAGLSLLWIILRGWIK